MKTLGALLRKLRKNKGVGIKTAAPAIGVDYSYLSKIENDKVVPSEKVIQKMSNYYSCDGDIMLLVLET